MTSSTPSVKRRSPVALSSGIAALCPLRSTVVSGTTKAGSIKARSITRCLVLVALAPAANQVLRSRPPVWKVKLETGLLQAPRDDSPAFQNELGFGLHKERPEWQ